jgi:hypothetical protein
MALAKPEEAHPAFNPAIYSLDVLLPGSEFNQQPVWIAEGGARWWAWACTVAGWILATALIASLRTRDRIIRVM